MVPLVYSPRYNITAFGLERLHPFDSRKYRRIHDWLAGKGGMPFETSNYVLAITGKSVEQWKAGSAEDSKQSSGLGCGALVALLRRAPNRFVTALQQRIVLGTMRPWGVIVGADGSRARMMDRYAALQQRHAAVLAGRDPILIERGRGPLPRFQVRIGADTRGEANDLCSRMHKDGGDCVVLRNTRA